MGVRLAAANHVGGIDVLDVALEFGFELLAEPLADVTELGVATSVDAGGGDELLTSALGEDDDGVSLSIQKV